MIYTQIYQEWKILFPATFILALVVSYALAKRTAGGGFRQFGISVLSGILASWATAIAIAIGVIGLDAFMGWITILGLYKVAAIFGLGVIPVVAVASLGAVVGWLKGAKRARNGKAVR